MRSVDIECSRVGLFRLPLAETLYVRVYGIGDRYRGPLYEVAQVLRHGPTMSTDYGNLVAADTVKVPGVAALDDRTLYIAGCAWKHRFSADMKDMIQRIASPKKPIDLEIDQLLLIRPTGTQQMYEFPEMRVDGVVAEELTVVFYGRRVKPNQSMFRLVQMDRE